MKKRRFIIKPAHLFKVCKARLFYRDEPQYVIPEIYKYSAVRLKKLLRDKKMQSRGDQAKLTFTNYTKLEAPKTEIVYKLYSKYSASGLAALFLQILLTLDSIDLEHNPAIVDLESRPVQFTSFFNWMGVSNPWEYFFYQPYDLNLESDKKAIVHTDIRELYGKHKLSGKKNFLTELSEDTISPLKKLVNQYFVPNEIVTEYLMRLKNEIEFSPLESFGTYFRGIRHPAADMQYGYTSEEMIKFIQDSKFITSNSKILLSSHSLIGKEYIRKKLDKKFNFYPEFRFKSKSQLSKKLKKEMRLQSGRPLDQLDYLAEMLLLGQCGYFLAEEGNASDFAFLNSNENQKRLILKFRYY